MTNDQALPIGLHLLAELGGCNPELLRDAASVKAALHEAAGAAGATVLSGYFHQFSPTGVSGILCLAESHISVHTWPAAGYAAADIFTCGASASPHAAIQTLARALQARSVSLTEVTRGLPPSAAEPQPKCQRQ